MTTALCLYALVLRNDGAAHVDDARPYYATATGTDSRRAFMLLLTAMLIVLYLMNGFLGIRLTPMPLAYPGFISHFAFGAAMLIAAPLAGRLMDRKPERFTGVILPVCCGLLVLSPSLAALEQVHWLHTVIQPLTATAQCVLAACCMLACEGLASSAARAGSYATSFLALRFLSILSMLLWAKIHADQGVTALAATVAAGVVYTMGRKARLTIRSSAEEAVPEPLPHTESDPDLQAENPGAVAAFLSTVLLTGREREIAEQVLQGKSTQEITVTLGISRSTARKHLTNVFRKFSVANTRELHARFAGSLTGGTGTAPADRQGDQP